MTTILSKVFKFIFCYLLSSSQALSQKIAVINIAAERVIIKGATLKVFKDNNISYSTFKNYINEEIVAATLSLKQNVDSIYFITDTSFSNLLLLLPTRLYNCFSTTGSKMDYVVSPSTGLLNSYHNQYEGFIISDDDRQQLHSTLKEFNFDYLLIFSSYKIYQPNTYFALTSEVFNNKMEKLSGIKHEFNRSLSRNSPPELIKYFVRKSILSHIEVLKTEMFVK